jgi:hypothetical protein
MKFSCFVCYHYSVASSKSLKVTFFNIESEVAQCNKCNYPLSTTNAKYEKKKKKKLFQFIIAKFAFFILDYDGRTQCIFKMNFDKLECMVLVELFHNSPIGPLDIPRIIEREQHYVI